MVEVEGEEHLKTAYEQKKKRYLFGSSFKLLGIVGGNAAYVGYSTRQQSHKRLSHSARWCVFAVGAV